MRARPGIVMALTAWLLAAGGMLGAGLLLGSTPNLLLSVLVAQTAVALPVLILAFRLPLADLGMGAATPRALLGGLALGPLAALLSLAAGMLFIIFVGPPPPDQPVERAIATIYDQTGWVGLLLITALLPGVVEEALFRGIILSGLRRRLPPGAAVLVCALAFALMHLSPWRFAPQLALGCLLGWLTLRTGSCWPAALAHAAHNGLVIAIARLAHVPST